VNSFLPTIHCLFPFIVTPRYRRNSPPSDAGQNESERQNSAMRPNLNLLFVLGLLCVEITSAVAIPRDQINELEARHFGRCRHRRCKGRHNQTTIATATRPAGPGLTTTTILTGGDVKPTTGLPGGGNNDDEEENEDSNEDGEGEEPESSAVQSVTYQPTSTVSAATRPTLTPISTTTAASNDDAPATTEVLPNESEIGSSPSILPTSNAEDPNDTPVETKTINSIPTTSNTASSTKSASTVPSATSVPIAGEYWKPTAGLTWQIQLAGAVTDLSLPVDVYDIDYVESSAEMISTLHTNNKKVICYFSAGSFESWRPDASSFLASDKGSPLEGWDNEWWLNTNSANVRTIMKARLDLAKSKGCDAVDPDNVDVYHNDNGLGITESQSIEYLAFLAGEAHARGMSMGLKNGIEMVPQLLDVMDFEVNESCMQFNECDKLTPFITAGKPVFHIEYNDNSATKKRAETAAEANCSFKGAAGFSSLLKNPNLDAYAQACTGTLTT
jgi:hypothetical protein